MDINDIFERLFNYFQTSTIRELSEKINMSESTVSKWRQRESINAIKKKCRELGIYTEIFDLPKAFPSYPPEYFNEDVANSNPYAQKQRELEKRAREQYLSKISKMDKTIVSSFLDVYQKLEDEGNLIKLYEALGKLKYDKS